GGPTMAPLRYGPSRRLELDPRSELQRARDAARPQGVDPQEGRGREAVAVRVREVRAVGQVVDLAEGLELSHAAEIEPIAQPRVGLEEVGAPTAVAAALVVDGDGIVPPARVVAA